MIQELRIYRIATGRVAAYNAHFEAVGLPIARKYMFLAGYWTSDFGTLNEVYHLWDFHDLKHREEIRARLHNDPDWQRDFMPKALELVQHQTSLVLRPTAFSPPSGSGLATPQSAQT